MYEFTLILDSRIAEMSICGLFFSEYLINIKIYVYSKIFEIIG